MDNVITAGGLGKSFVSAGERIEVFRDLELVLAPGESLALTGASGSGKSTLLHILCGLESLDRGSLALFGKDAAAYGADDWAALRRRRIGMVFQDANLMPALTLAENVRLRASLAGDQDQYTATTWLGRLGLEGLDGRYPDQVSGGQRQRAALAMMFAMAPALILADEPTGSLDRRTAEAVARVVFQWQRERDCPLILATHDRELARHCDRILDLSGAH